MTTMNRRIPPFALRLTTADFTLRLTTGGFLVWNGELFTQRDRTYGVISDLPQLTKWFENYGTKMKHIIDNANNPNH